MLYLLRSYTENGSILKLGYAGNLDRRLYMYFSHNPGAKFLGSREGGLLEETKFHLYFHALGYGSVMNEWYKDEEDIIRCFESMTLDEVDEYLWKNRETTIKITPVLKEIPSQEVQVYQNLMEKYKFDMSQNNLTEIRKNKADLDYYTLYYSGGINGIMIDEKTPEELIDFIKGFNGFSFFTDRMRLLCSLDKDVINRNYNYLEMILPKEDYLFYYNIIGPEKCRALKYQNSLIKKEYDAQVFKQDSTLVDRIYKTFEVGKKYTKQYIKEELRKIYEEFEKDIVPKATDLLGWFQLGDCTITNKDTGKRDKGFEILKKI